ncbi:hypothetical protein M3P05_09005 [Sansalvadorimonas sp. 2012CJ34-2]|uniref:Uncharacterized protein n=1 Tax=Parendozoicomonas callyspongiae TaxID=2942213 RepID=A0ABT0PFB6_9GAMM|nr:hypothetical protein [Sansalvadorimonas sp. 2012CJ34-2]MCL6270069.1 hypothetical protein [Sansalvadorimonas sp. 2012CJ34-2]
MQPVTRWVFTLPIFLLSSLASGSYGEFPSTEFQGTGSAAGQSIVITFQPSVGVTTMKHSKESLTIENMSFEQGTADKLFQSMKQASGYEEENMASPQIVSWMTLLEYVGQIVQLGTMPRNEFQLLRYSPPIKIQDTNSFLKDAEDTVFRKDKRLDMIDMKKAQKDVSFHAAQRVTFKDCVDTLYRNTVKELHFEFVQPVEDSDFQLYGVYLYNSYVDEVTDGKYKITSQLIGGG